MGDPKYNRLSVLTRSTPELLKCTKVLYFACSSNVLQIAVGAWPGARQVPSITFSKLSELLSCSQDISSKEKQLTRFKAVSKSAF